MSKLAIEANLLALLKHAGLQPVYDAEGPATPEVEQLPNGSLRIARIEAEYAKLEPELQARVPHFAYRQDGPYKTNAADMTAAEFNTYINTNQALVLFPDPDRATGVYRILTPASTYNLMLAPARVPVDELKDTFAVPGPNLDFAGATLDDTYRAWAAHVADIAKNEGFTATYERLKNG